jgi:hypothetical protein
MSRVRVKDFNPRFPEIWRDASLNEIVMPMDSHGQAVHFRQQLNICRKAMKAEGHQFSGAAQKAKVKIEYQSRNQWFASTNNKDMEDRVASAWRLRMMPRDGGFDAMQERAGHKAPVALDPTELERTKRDILA